MRMTVVVLTFLIAATAFAQQDKPNSFSVFLGDPTYLSDAQGREIDGQFGVALQRMFAPHFSAEIAVSHETVLFADRSVRSGFFGNRRVGFTPVDLSARYHFPNESRWKPYLGVMTRYVDGETFVGANGGVLWQFRPTLGLRFDGKALVSSSGQGTHLLHSVGLSWRF